MMKSTDSAIPLVKYKVLICVQQLVSVQSTLAMPKTGAERTRAYRERQRAKALWKLGLRQEYIIPDYKRHQDSDPDYQKVPSKAEKYYWNVRLIKILIAEYKKNELLFNSRHPDYRNYNKRLVVYKNILNILNLEQPGLQLEELKRKISGLRGQYLTEKLKVIKSRQDGSFCEYKPSVYWFPLLKFLDVVIDASIYKSESNLHDDCLENKSSSNTDYDEEMPVDPIVLHQSQEVQNYEAAIQQPQDVGTLAKATREMFAPDKLVDPILIQQPQTIQIREVANKQSEYNSRDNDRSIAKMKTIPEPYKLTTQLEKAEDEVITFGKFVISELRAISATATPILYRQAKRKIQEVLINTWDIIDSTPIASARLSSFISESTHFNDDESIIDNFSIKTENFE